MPRPDDSGHCISRYIHMMIEDLEISKSVYFKVNTMIFVPCDSRIWGVNSKQRTIEDRVLRDRLLQESPVLQFSEYFDKWS